LAGACQQREGGLLTQEQFTRRITLLRIGKEDLFPGVMSQFLATTLQSLPTYREKHMLLSVFTPGGGDGNWGGFLAPIDELVEMGWVPERFHADLMAASRLSGGAMPRLSALLESQGLRVAIDQVQAQNTGVATPSGKEIKKRL